MEEGQQLCNELLERKIVLCNVLSEEVSKVVEEQAMTLSKKWKSEVQMMKIKEFMRETRQASEDMISKMETACGLFRTQLETVEENLDIQQIYQVC